MTDDILTRIGRQVREHDTRLDLYEERLKGLERLCDADLDGDLRRRIEHIERIQAEHNAMIGRLSDMIGRLNETLLDLKKQLDTLRNVETDVTRIKVITNITALIGSAIVLSAIGLVTTYLFKVPT